MRSTLREEIGMRFQHSATMSTLRAMTPPLGMTPQIVARYAVNSNQAVFSVLSGLAPQLFELPLQPASIAHEYNLPLRAGSTHAGIAPLEHFSSEASLSYM